MHYRNPCSRHKTWRLLWDRIHSRAARWSARFGRTSRRTTCKTRRTSARSWLTTSCEGVRQGQGHYVRDEQVSRTASHVGNLNLIANHTYVPAPAGLGPKRWCDGLCHNSGRGPSSGITGKRAVLRPGLTNWGASPPLRGGGPGQRRRPLGRNRHNAHRH